AVRAAAAAQPEVDLGPDAGAEDRVLAALGVALGDGAEELGPRRSDERRGPEDRSCCGGRYSLIVPVWAAAAFPVCAIEMPSE
ncbi:MAG: hypothetical protein REI11_01345, partial [Patulibacter sp.]|nr:hypothetical protein [Patulibacter sp.]